MVYLIHFAKPFHHAKHYVGFSTDADSLPRRIERHASGRGSKLMAAVARAGIGFHVVRTWPDATRDDERKLKNAKNTPRFCPVCRGEVRRAA
jgi:hypothetical protein